MKQVSAFSLPAVIVVCIIMSILVLFVISLSDLNQLYYSYYCRIKKQNEDINSLFLLYRTDSTFLKEVAEKGSYQLYDDQPATSVTMEVQPWGLYEFVKIRALDDSFSSVRLFGQAIDCDYEAALWVCNNGKPLVLGETAQIMGNSYFPMGLIQYSSISKHDPLDNKVKTRYINPSGTDLPRIVAANKYLWERYYMKKANGIPPIGIDNQTIRCSFWQDEVHFFMPPERLDISVSGQVILHGDRVRLSVGDTLNDAILIARSVTVEEGFTGCLQILASDTVVLQQNTHLYYPSGIYLRGGRCGAYLQMDKHSTLDGYAVVTDSLKRKVEPDKMKMPNVLQHPEAIFNGLLYVDGIADLRGICYGGTYLKECQCTTDDKNPTHNMLCTAKIYRNAHLGFPIFFEQSQYSRREMKTLY